jgi:two-component system C4-dicarboxylate transport response regulator DctD
MPPLVAHLQPPELILADFDTPSRKDIAKALTCAGFDVTCCSFAATAIARIKPDFRGVVVASANLPDMDGLTLVKHARDCSPHVTAILLTGLREAETIAQAVRHGVQTCLERPFPMELLIDTARKAVKEQQLREQAAWLRQEVRTLKERKVELLGSSTAIEETRRQIGLLFDSHASVLLLGEPGTGRESAAKYIHMHGNQRDGPLVSFDCEGFPASLLELEIFGGSNPSGPLSPTRAGMLHRAQGGSLLLEGVEALPPHLLHRLLGPAACGHSAPTEATPTSSARIIATARFAPCAASAGNQATPRHFDAVVCMPSLRERRQDIPILMAHFLKRLANDHGMRTPSLSDDDMATLVARDWPGNVDELKAAALWLVLSRHLDKSEP